MSFLKTKPNQKMQKTLIDFFKNFFIITLTKLIKVYRIPKTFTYCTLFGGPRSFSTRTDKKQVSSLTLPKCFKKPKIFVTQFRLLIMNNSDGQKPLQRTFVDAVTQKHQKTGQFQNPSRNSQLFGRFSCDILSIFAKKPFQNDVGPFQTIWQENLEAKMRQFC